jgi:S-formylglutathione hydrolase FrmB
MRPGRWRRSEALLVGSLLVTGVGLAAPVAASIAPPSRTAVSFHDADGIHVVAARHLGGRQYNVSVQSKALGQAVNVRILLPSGYTANPERRWPVLYLFHGTSGRASDWVTQGDAKQTTAGRPLITVMPDAGFDGDGGGWFTNWVDTHTSLGPSQWETFDIHDLIPWVDANLRTIAHRRGRAIAGLSQGGFGATSYAARHPDMFVAAASFSGAPEIDVNPTVIAGATAIIDATAVGLDGVEPDAMFGDRATHEINWRGHDPSTLMTNLRGMKLSLWTATGVPGKYDKGINKLNPGGSAIEAMTHISTVDFHKRLVAAGIPSHYDNYVYGTHTFPYWARDLREFIGPLMKTFANPPARRRVVSYLSIDEHWAQWGWRVSLQRKTRQQFSALTHASRYGFDLNGVGIAHVKTPAFYRPGSVIAVRLTGGALHSTLHLTVGRNGRLSIRFPLDSGNTRGTRRIVIRAPRP